MPCCTVAGDLCIAQFDGEAEVTLFVPDSGAVLMARAHAWDALHSGQNPPFMHEADAAAELSSMLGVQLV
jgi:hypothetical protein